MCKKQAAWRNFMPQMEENESFGQLLRAYRKQAYVKRVGPLSQEKFARMLSERTGIVINRNHVIRWEKDISPIQAKERITLVGIVAVLVENQGISTLEDANRLLKAGNYGLLSDEEISEVNPQWLVTTSKPAAEETRVISAESPGKPDKARPATVIFKVEEPLPVVIQGVPMGPGSAPPPPSLIVGRDDDLRALKEHLGIGLMEKPEFAIQVLTAIKGWPGVGKTTVASALAYDSEMREAFPDGILWVSLGVQPNLLSELAAWGRALGTDKLIRARTVEEARSQLAALLREKRMLLIVDDVWKPEHAMPFTVGGPGCATLITTRQEDVARILAPTARNIYRLTVLKDEDALDLLKQLAPGVVDRHPAECLVLVQALEGLPLALQVAGRLLHTEASYGFGVTELMADLREGAKLLEAAAPADRSDLASETTPTISALLHKSLDRLDDETRERYTYLGAFAPKPATFDMKAMKHIWRMDDPAPVIKTLVDRGLLEAVPEVGRYQIHALLVMLAKSLYTDD
jgi:hypothetical protein